ncbi:MAG TPA: hypothetical protein VII92_20475, partial [Anaerolineae bacterium]
MVNRHNYQLVREYLDYLTQVSQLEPRSVERYWFYLRHLLLWADEILLGKVASIRPGFPFFLSKVHADCGDEGFAPSTSKKIIQTVKRFLIWSKMNSPAEFRDLPSSWIEALHSLRVDQPMKEHTFVTLDEIRQLMALKVDPGDLATWRDQAAAAMLFLSGMRAGAFGSMPISVVDLPNRTIKQWPSLGVKTKNHKSA